MSNYVNREKKYDQSLVSVKFGGGHIQLLDSQCSNRFHFMSNALCLSSRVLSTQLPFRKPPLTCMVGCLPESTMVEIYYLEEGMDQRSAPSSGLASKRLHTGLKRHNAFTTG